MKNRMFLLGAALAVMLAACSPKHSSTAVSGTIETDEIRVASRAGGRIAELLAREGDSLAPGQPVVRLNNPELPARRAALAGTCPERLAAARVQLAEAEAQLSELTVVAPTIRVDAFAGRDFKGAIEQIARAAEFTPRNVQTTEERVQQVFGVKVRLEKAGGDLRAGLAADVTFANGKN